MKACRKCGEAKPFSEYNKHPQCRDGLRPECRECQREWRRQFRADNLERELAREQARRQDPVHREKQSAAWKRWHSENLDHAIAYRKAQYAANRDGAITAAVEWAKANPERHRASRLAYDERKRGYAMTEDDKAYVTVLLHDPCAYCGGPTREIDHIDPLRHGGAGSWDNLTTACRRCNSSKKDKPLLAFLAHQAI